MLFERERDRDRDRDRERERVNCIVDIIKNKTALSRQVVPQSHSDYYVTIGIAKWSKNLNFHFCFSSLFQEKITVENFKKY